MHSPSNGDLAAMGARAGEAGPRSRLLLHDPIARPPSAERLSGIDAARGIAMVLVCLSHIRYHFQHAPEIYAVLTYVTRIATPTFLLLSGFVAAHVLASNRTGARIAIVDRALCVLVVGHLLLNIEELPQVGLNAWLFARVTVTDAIAISLIVAALCARVSARWLLIAGAALAIVSWPIAITASSDSPVGHYLLVVLFDARGHQSELVDAAIAPYLGLFLIGMALSKSAAHLIASRQQGALARKLLVVSAIAISTVLCAAFLWHVLKDVAFQLLQSPDAIVWIRQTLKPTQKLPPSPAYLALYGGVGLIIASACLARRPRVILVPITNWASAIGRASLLAFVVQDWLLRSIPVLLEFDGLSSPLFWVFYFVATIFILHWLAVRWDAARANRFLTVGLKSLIRRHRIDRHPPAPIRSIEGTR